MQRFKNIMMITSVSFMLVVVLNAILILLKLSSFNIDAVDIMQIFGTCLLIATLIMMGEKVSFIREYIWLYSYFVMLMIAVGMNFMINQRFYWINLGIEIFFLSLVYAGVVFFVFCIHERDAKMINRIILRKRNVK